MSLLGKMLKGPTVQVVFSFVLPVSDWDAGRRRWTGQVNEWWRGWCRAQGLGFYDLGHTFDGPGMLTLDGTQLSRWGKSILGSKLVGLIRRALNYMEIVEGDALLSEESIPENTIILSNSMEMFVNCPNVRVLETQYNQLPSWNTSTPMHAVWETSKKN